MNNSSHLQDRDEARSGQAWRLLFAAWSIALAATLGALFIGEVMGQRPCTLCWHQRAFMFPLAVVLAVACFRSDPQVWRYALPLAGIGWLFSGYHSLLYTGVISEPITPCDSTIPCSGAGMTLWGYLPIPLLSFASFSAIALLLVAVYRKNTP